MVAAILAALPLLNPARRRWATGGWLDGSIDDEVAANLAPADDGVARPLATLFELGVGQGLLAARGQLHFEVDGEVQKALAETVQQQLGVVVGNPVRVLGAEFNQFGVKRIHACSLFSPKSRPTPLSEGRSLV